MGAKQEVSIQVQLVNDQTQPHQVRQAPCQSWRSYCRDTQISLVTRSSKTQQRRVVASFRWKERSRVIPKRTLPSGSSFSFLPLFKKGHAHHHISLQLSRSLFLFFWNTVFRTDQHCCGELKDSVVVIFGFSYSIQYENVRCHTGTLSLK